MSAEENIEVVRRFSQALTDRDWAAFDDLVAEDCEWTDVPSGTTIHGRAELVALCKVFTAAFPDFAVENVTLIGQGDLVANEWRGTGTHQAALPAPTAASTSRRAARSCARASGSWRSRTAGSSATATTSTG